MCLGLAGVAQARAASAWVVEDLRGTVVRLAVDRWLEVSEGETIGTTAVLQALAGSSAELRIGGVRLELGPDTALMAMIGPKANAVSVDQYSGSLEIVVAKNSRTDIAVRTPGLVVSSSGGSLSVEVNGDVTEIAVASGTVTALDTASGKTLILADGQSVADLRAEIVTGTDAAATRVVETAANEGSSGAANAAVNTTPANAGGGSSSNAGGNSSSNAGGNSSSNAGGNPNSNAGGNQNSNAGGNPNPNAGGNSNAGGNPNSNAGGNDTPSGGTNSNAGPGNNNGGANPKSGKPEDIEAGGNGATNNGKGNGSPKNSGNGS